MRRIAIAGVVLVALAGCKKKPDEALAADAEIVSPRGPIEIAHAETGFTMVAPETWIRSPQGDATLIADLRRPAPIGQPTLAPPRIVVMARQRDTPLDADKGVEREIDELKTVQASGALDIVRTARARRLLGGIDMGELRVDYRVRDPRGGPDANVVHRVWVGPRPGTDGKPWEVVIVFTYQAADEDVIARETEDVLRSVHFASPEEPK